MIAVFAPICKCARLQFFCSLQGADGNLNFPEYHLGNIAGGDTQNRNGIVGVEIQHMGKILERKVLCGSISTPGQQHEPHAAT